MSDQYGGVVVGLTTCAHARSMMIAFSIFWTPERDL